MLRRLVSVIFIAFALALPRGARGQTVAAPEQHQASANPPAASSLPAGPTVDAATAGLRLEETVQIPTRGVVVAQARRGNDATALMIVGGAAFLAGAIIGGDAGTIIMVGGAGIGLYGLYLYLQ